MGAFYRMGGGHLIVGICLMCIGSNLRKRKVVGSIAGKNGVTGGL